MIGKEADLHVAGEASDGLEAVQKAKALKPDLVLLDIGLPKLNGIEVARQIQSRAPRSKILFLSQESSPDVVREALKLGVGFVVKTDAARELLSAVNAVTVGRQFLSSRLADTLRDAEEVLCGTGRDRAMKQLSSAKHANEISAVAHCAAKRSALRSNYRHSPD